MFRVIFKLTCAVCHSRLRLVRPLNQAATTQSTKHTSRMQSMKINHRKTSRPIETNLCQLVNWHRSVLVNRWSVDSHISCLPITSISIDCFWLLFRFRAMKIDDHIILSNRLLIDFQYQSINCYRLTNSSIAYAGSYGKNKVAWEPEFFGDLFSPSCSIQSLWNILPQDG